MRKILISLLVLGLSLNLSATIIDFESATLGTTGNVVLNTGNSGAGGVIANPSQTGINTSAQVLHVTNSAYGNLNFPDLVLPLGAPANYAYWRIRCKILVMSGSDVNYPTLYFGSSTDNTSLGTVMGQIGPWGTAVINKWVQCDFIVSTSALTTIPGGILSLKLEKNGCEYCIDDVEIVPGPNVSVFKETFESFAIGTTGGAEGADGVFANPSTAGINPSAQALHKTFAGYGVVSFPNITLPAGTPVTYPLTIVKCKMLVISGTDTDYPTLYFGSSTDNNLGSVIGQIGPWGTAAKGTWVNCQYIINNSSLASIPAGHLTMKLEKNACEYAIDDVELFSNVQGYILTGITQAANNANAYFYNNQFVMSQVADKAEVFDVNGRLLIAAKNTSIVNLSKLSHGIYIVKTQINGVKSVTKISK